MTENQKDKKNVIKKKSVYNCYLLPTSDTSDFHHYHQTSLIPYLHHCDSKNSHSKVKSLQDLPELSYKLAPRHNYSPYPGANSLNQLLPHRDNAIYTYPCESLQNCENCRQSHYPFTEHFKIGSKYLRINRQAISHEGNYVQSPELVQEKREMPVATLLYRSRSLPQLSIVHDSGLGSVQDNGPVRLHSKLVTDLRQLLTLKQHYYPEGGWGWLILVVGVLVQILSSGIHGAAGIFIHHVAMRFNVEVYLEAGELHNMLQYHGQQHH